MTSKRQKISKNNLKKIHHDYRRLKKQQQWIKMKTEMQIDHKDRGEQQKKKSTTTE